MWKTQTACIVWILFQWGAIESFFLRRGTWFEHYKNNTIPILPSSWWVMWNIQICFIFKFLQVTWMYCCDLHIIFHVYYHLLQAYIQRIKRQVSRVNGISDDDYGSNLNLNKTKVTNTSPRRRKAEGSHRIRSRKEREERELWGWQWGKLSCGPHFFFFFFYAAEALSSVKGYLDVVCPDGITSGR